MSDTVCILLLATLLASGCSTTNQPSPRKLRLQAQHEERQALLARIPEHHPQREDLRVIAVTPPPEGYSSEEWLELSKKVQFGGTGATGRSKRVLAE